MNDELKDILSGMQKELSQLNKHAGHISHSLGKMSFNIGKTTPEPVGGDPVAKELKRIANFILHGDRDGMTIYDPQDSNIKNLQQATLQLQLKQMQEELERSKSKNTPKYDKALASLIIDNTVIALGNDTHENKLCDVVLKSAKTMNKEWSWDEIVESWGESFEHFDSKVIYRTGNRINKKVAAKTQVKELFRVTTKTIRVNPEILK